MDHADHERTDGELEHADQDTRDRQGEDGDNLSTDVDLPDQDERGEDGDTQTLYGSAFDSDEDMEIEDRCDKNYRKMNKIFLMLNMAQYNVILNV